MPFKFLKRLSKSNDRAPSGSIRIAQGPLRDSFQEELLERVKLGALKARGRAGLSGERTISSAYTFLTLPADMTDRSEVKWRIQLHGLGPNVRPLGLELLGDVVLGRGKAAPDGPDLDLDPYGGIYHGVSRRHAMFRPTRNALYLLDLGSTNGSFYNGIPVISGMARSLSDKDMVSLGALSFQIRIIDRPQ